MRALIALICLLAIALAEPAAAEKRVALVIGNAAYTTLGPLRNPRNDAEDVAAALTVLGFDVVVGLDLDRGGMEDTVETFAAKAETADVALFYYAGHAMQHQGVNYLMPVDATLAGAGALRRLTKLTDVVGDLRKAKALRILMLDACRDNPLAERLGGADAAAGQRSAGLAKLSRGLTAEGEAPAAGRGGDIIVYAAEAGRTAADGTGRNSPFTEAFLQHVTMEGQEVVALMRRVTDAVQRSTGHAQRPELSLSVPFEFYFRPGPPAPPPAVRQILPGARPHEVGAVEATIERLVAGVPESGRVQTRREILALLTDIVERSGLRADQIADALPEAYGRLQQLRTTVEEYRQLAANEPGVAPFVELAAAAVASGRRPDLQAADQALQQAQGRYDEAVRLREQAVERTRAQRAMLIEQRAQIAEAEARHRDAAQLFRQAAADTPASEPRLSAIRHARAASSLWMQGLKFAEAEPLQTSVSLIDTEVLPRLSGDDDKRLRALALAQKGRVLLSLGERLTGRPGLEAMVAAMRALQASLPEIRLEDDPFFVMNVMEGRAMVLRTLAMRLPGETALQFYDGALGTLATIQRIQQNHQRHGDIAQTLITTGNIQFDMARRSPDDAAAALFDRAIGVYREARQAAERAGDRTALAIAEANLAAGLTERARRFRPASAIDDLAEARRLLDAAQAHAARDRFPTIWMPMQRFRGNLDRARAALALDAPDARVAQLGQAFAAYQQALAIQNARSSPMEWGQGVAHLGFVLAESLPLLDPADRAPAAAEARRALREAIRVFGENSFTFDRTTAEAALAEIDRIMGAPPP